MFILHLHSTHTTTAHAFQPNSHKSQHVKAVTHAPRGPCFDLVCLCGFSLLVVFVQGTPVKRILGAGHTERGGIKGFAKSAHLKHQLCYYTSSKVLMLCFDEEKDNNTRPFLLSKTI